MYFVDLINLNLIRRANDIVVAIPENISILLGFLVDFGLESIAAYRNLVCF